MKEKEIDFPRAVKKIRKHLKMTQEAFAFHLGVHVETIRRWEQGRSNSKMGLTTVKWLYECENKHIPRKAQS